MSRPEKKTVEGDIAAADSFTDALVAHTGERVSISISGAFTATVHLQRSFDGSTWHDVDSWTAGTQETYVADEGCEIRLGVKSGNYTSGTATCRLGKGG